MNIRSPFAFLTIFTQSPEGKLWEDGGFSTDAGPTAPAPPAAAPTQPASAAAVPATPATAPSAPTTSGVPEGYVPSYRLREAREAAERQYRDSFTAKENDYKAQLERVNNQLKALVGVNPSNPDQDRAAQIRQQFSELFPGVAKLEEKAALFEQLAEQAANIESQTQHYWRSYGKQTMDNLFREAEATLGSPLSDEGKRSLHSAFVGFVQSSPEMQERYAQDPNLVKEYWQAFSTSLIDPARRSASAQLAQRAGAVTNLPQDTPGGAPRTPAPPSQGSIEDRAAAAWAQYQLTAKK